jgi:hypothetical protein
MITPSVKRLSLIFGDKAKQAKTILLMKSSELAELPAGKARIRECYYQPKTYDIRLHCLNYLLGSYGVEGFELKDGSYCDYLNTGETYSLTLVRFRGNYYVRDWGSIAERYAT